MPLSARTLLALLTVLSLAACSPARDTVATPTAPDVGAASAEASQDATPSTSSAQVTVEPSDKGIEAVRALHRAIRQGKARPAWAMLGPRTREAVGTRADLDRLDTVLAPLLDKQLAPFDDVIVAQTPAVSTHLVVLGDRDTPEPVAAEVVRSDDEATIELSPPTPSEIDFDIQRRQRIAISTPAADDVELTIDGFHFRPTVADDGGPAVMHIPFPLTPRTHVFGAWFHGDDGTSGVGAATVDVPED